jgi:outer membrane cobalamin receptor
MNTTRLLLSLALLSVASIVSAAPPQAAKPVAALSRTVVFDIPAQSLSSALLQFSTQSGVEFTVATKALEGRRVAAVKGSYATDRALALLLANTGLKFETVDDGTVAIRPERDPSVGTSTEGRAAGVEELRLARIAGPEATTAIVEPAVQSPAPAAEESTEIQVTGSRIRGAQGEITAHPVVTYTREDLQRLGATTLGDIRRVIPQISVNNKTDGAGVSGRNVDLPNNVMGPAQSRVTMDMRGLPNNATLILVDGRRLGRSGQDSSADNYGLEGLPLSAIDRIEVLAAGAGAVYGADAVAGAINIILKKQYSGTDVAVTYDNTFDGDAAVKNVSVSPGYSRNKFNALGNFSFQETNAMAATDRWFTASDDRRPFGGTDGRNSIPGGRGIVYSTDGQPLPGLSVSQVTIPAGASGQSATVADYANAGPLPEPLDSALHVNLINPQRQQSALLKLGYDHSPHAAFFLDGRWSETDNTVRGLPPAVASFPGFPSFSFQVPAGYPGNPFGVPVLVSKWFWDYPLPESIKSKGASAATGVRGAIAGDWRYETSAHWARSELQNNRYSLSTAKLTEALTHPDPSLRPNIFDDSTAGASPNSAGLLIGLSQSYPSAEVSDVYVYGLHADGSLFNLPTGAVRTAVGMEYTDEEVRFLHSPDDTTSFAAVARPNGRNIRSAFGEIRVPLAPAGGRLPLLHRLELSAQARSDSYSDFGSKVSPGYSVLYAPFQWLSLRGSRTEGYKVPVLFDLYSPPRTFFGFLQATSGPSAVRDPLRNDEVITGLMSVSSAGNPNLQAEESVSNNFGVVLQVPWVAGLSLYADRYDIDYTNRSGGAGLQDILLLFPERVTRGAPLGDGLPGRVTGYDSSPLNIAGLRTKGWDYRLTYDLATKWGDLSLHAQYTEVDSYVSQAIAGAPLVSRELPRRGSASLFWADGPMEIGVNANYQSAYMRTVTIRAAGQLGFDPQFSYDFGRDPEFTANAATWWQRGLADTRLSVTVINAFYDEVTEAQAARGLWTLDPRLRRFVVSFNKRF